MGLSVTVHSGRVTGLREQGSKRLLAWGQLLLTPGDFWNLEFWIFFKSPDFKTLTLCFFNSIWDKNVAKMSEPVAYTGNHSTRHSEFILQCSLDVVLRSVTDHLRG